MASILLISKARRVSRGTQGGVVLVHGASVLDGNNKATANLKPSLNPTSPIDLSMDDMAIRFHVGIGEGESYYESGIWFKGGTEEGGFSKQIVTAPSLFSGSDREATEAIGMTSPSTWTTRAYSELLTSRKSHILGTRNPIKKIVSDGFMRPSTFTQAPCAITTLFRA